MGNPKNQPPLRIIRHHDTHYNIHFPHKFYKAHLQDHNNLSHNYKLVLYESILYHRIHDISLCYYIPYKVGNNAYWFLPVRIWSCNNSCH